MRTLFLVNLIFASLTLASELKYTTSCEIKNGYGIGYVHNIEDAFEIDGQVWFYFFDNRGDLISKEDEHEYEYVSRRASEEIEKTSAPSRAATCSFNIDSAIKKSGAVGVSPRPIKESYTTACRIEKGKAIGSVHNLEDAFEIDGYVWFYFFDNRGSFISKEDEYEYEYVSRRATEEIEETSAPSNAATCTFEIKTAIKSK